MERPLSEREIYLEERLHQIEKQFQEFQQTLGKKTTKGKGKGKKSKNFDTEVQEEAQRRLQQFLATQQRDTSQTQEENFQATSSQGINLPSSSDSQRFQSCSRLSDSGSTNSSRVRTTATKEIYIKKIEITINGTPVLLLTNLFWLIDKLFTLEIGG
jgi:hypothetical protein